MVTGSSGLVGTWLRRTAPIGVEIVSLVHETTVSDTTSVVADLRDLQDVVTAFETSKPAVVIHAAMAVDERSIVDATDNVAHAASRVEADVIFISSDAVFSGGGRRVEEESPPDPIWDYGRWKLRAEARILRERSGWAVVRLPLVVSLNPPDHAVRRIRQGSRSHPTQWFTDETRQPAAAADIAAGIWRIVLLAGDDRSGVWHLPGPERLTRFEIAQRVVDALDLDPDSIASALTPPGTERPRHLDLGDQRARAAIAWDPAPILRT